VDCEESLKFALVERTKARLASKNIEINDIDGVRAEFGDAWGLVRASNTQPVIVLRFEAPSQARLKEVRTLIENELTAAAQDVGHPELQLSGGAAH
jgi:phosphomannomutase/phosphoglucomutase